MIYTIYFHDMVEELAEVDENEQYTGCAFWDRDTYARFLNPSLKVRYMEEFKRENNLHGTTCDTYQYNFECWLEYFANDDKEAIAIVGDVLKDNDFDWVDVFYILENDRVVHTVNIDLSLDNQMTK